LHFESKRAHYWWRNPLVQKPLNLIGQFLSTTSRNNLYNVGSFWGSPVWVQIVADNRSIPFLIEHRFRSHEKNLQGRVISGV
jgi:hypothetical protein